MHGHTQLAPHYFFRQQRLLRALLIDDQAWFVLDDFARLIEHSQPEQMLARLDDDQARRESLRSERGEDQAQWLISESGAYAALIYQQRGDGGELRRGLSGEVVPEWRSATDDSGMPRYVKLRWERQVVHMLDWQGKLWVNFSEMPDLLERQGEPMVQLGWRRWLSKLRPL
ncbi:Bro-N domain-containing protein [Pseudomonas aeruginosa]|nr:Bro-N domain-containing protein [Pseudomonas aeruginosa]